MPSVDHNLRRVRKLMLMRNRFTMPSWPSDLDWSAPSRPALPAGRMGTDGGDPVLGIRWDMVRAIRQAIACGRYDVEARLDDLLDDPPADLAGFGWS